MKHIRILLLLIYILGGCSKAEFLSKEPDSSKLELKTLDQLQALLDYDLLMNGRERTGIDPNYLLIGADDYFMPEPNLTTIVSDPFFRNLYTWNDKMHDTEVDNWSRIYTAIFYANAALDGLDQIVKNNENGRQYDFVKGASLFFRARFFFQLAQVFAPPYNSLTAESDLGVVLRLKSDVNEKLKRSTVKETYDKIIGDLKEAAVRLPVTTNLPYKTRPNKAAAYMMLAKVLLLTKDYQQSLKYADSALTIQNKLMDFNDFTSATQTSTALPIPVDNPEVIFFSMFMGTYNTIVSPSLARIDSTLYKSYELNDLRRNVFFTANAANDVTFKGNYIGYFDNYFSGLAVDELYLIRAENKVRLGLISEGLQDLNTLMVKRWKVGSFVPFSTSDPSTALALILTERRKELVQRGTRWTDLRRLNLEGYNISITRILENQTYTLKPNDKRYTSLIPPNVISINPSIIQNAR
ncbi:RagB/SusD family nutrient uptake outer membrane protein [Pedobacter africanus]|uniref:SusD family protein n=1 Tax=Pedobacter africanus TaxID=151894 RepID=A0A1W2B0G0_9SPHI|nr:RagB/SusD family nutrient uptake outer membrane protein [Pedobacter africanus]SMC66201.1 SusD family protein [Pedobacter africanus]